MIGRSIKIICAFLNACTYWRMDWSLIFTARLWDNISTHTRSPSACNFTMFVKIINQLSWIIAWLPFGEPKKLMQRPRKLKDKYVSSHPVAALLSLKSFGMRVVGNVRLAFKPTAIDFMLLGSLCLNGMMIGCVDMKQLSCLASLKTFIWNSPHYKKNTKQRGNHPLVISLYSFTKGISKGTMLI